MEHSNQVEAQVKAQVNEQAKAQVNEQVKLDTTQCSPDSAIPLQAKTQVELTTIPLKKDPVSISRTMMIIDFLNEYGFNNTSRNILSNRYSIGVHWDGDIAIFYNKGHKYNKLASEANGLIINCSTLEPIVVPNRTTYEISNTNSVLDGMSKNLYKISKVLDSTVFHLSYRANEWVISTTRGINMNKVKWNNGKTFKQLIEECLLHINLTWQDLEDTLLTTHSYSFGFTHPDIQKFHPVDVLYNIYFIQKVNLDSYSQNYLWCDFDSPIKLIKQQPSINNISLSILLSDTNNAIANYEQYGTVCYGFILRSVNTSYTGSNSDIIIKSDLLKFIEKVVYNNNRGKDTSDKVAFNEVLQVYNTKLADTYKLLFKSDEIFTYLDELTKYLYYEVTNELNQLTEGISDLVAREYLTKPPNELDDYPCTKIDNYKKTIDEMLLQYKSSTNFYKTASLQDTLKNVEEFFEQEIKKHITNLLNLAN